MRNSRSFGAATGAFTLVEIMIVVVIIGLLATMAVAAFSRIREKSENSRVMNDLRVFAAAFEQYALEHGEWPPDVNPGVFPVEMTGLIKDGAFTALLPGGGHYDWDNGSIGPAADINLFGITWSDARLIKLDQLIDDGNLNTGRFRRGSGGVM